MKLTDIQARYCERRPFHIEVAVFEGEENRGVIVMRLTDAVNLVTEITDAIADAARMLDHIRETAKQDKDEDEGLEP